jgi:heme-degrading monooxygenase HmoA
MHCRTVEGSISSDKLEAALDGLKANVVPRLSSLPGFTGAYWLADRKAGTVLAATFYDSKESLEASREAAEQIRSKGMEAGGVTFTGSKEWEVIAETGEKIHSSASHARVIRSNINATQVEEMGDTIRANVIPALQPMAGFAGGFWLANSETREGLSGILWESEGAMKDSAEAARILRDKLVSEGKVEFSSVEEYDIPVRVERPAAIAR